jgi:hypothetical protein
MRETAMTTTTLNNRRPAAGDTLDCGHVLEPRAAGDIATGYAYHSVTQRTMCYWCADESARSEMVRVDMVTQYVNSEGTKIVTWSGGELGRVVDSSVWAGGWNGSLIHSWTVVDSNGGRWHGRNGGPGMAVTLRRLKGK